MPAELGSQDITNKQVSRTLSPEVQRRSDQMYHYLLGELSVKKDDLSGAIQNFEKASELSTSPSPVLHVKLSELELRSGNLLKAHEESKKAMDLAPTDAKILVLHAGILEGLKKTEDAIYYYKQAIQFAPAMIDPYIFLAGIYLRDSKNDEAITMLKGYVKNYPDEPVAQLYLGKAYEQKGDLHGAREALKRAYQLRIENEQLAFEYIRILVKLDKFDEAKEVCEAILERNPDQQLARKVLGQVLLGERQFDEALKHFQILESVEDDATDTRYKIALIQIERRNFEDAIRELHLVLATKPSFSEARYALGTALAGVGNFQDASHELMRIGKGDPFFSRARTYASLLFRQMGDLRKAESTIRDVITSGEPNSSTRLYLISILREGGKLDEAKKELDGIVAAEPENDKLRFEQVVLYDEMGKNKEALQTAEEILQRSPESEEVLNYIAYSLAQKKKDLARAETLAKKAASKRPNEPYFLDTLGWVYYQQGKFSEAVEHLGFASQGAPEDPVILEHYGLALEKAGKPQEADVVYRKAISFPRHASDKDAQDAFDRMKKRVDKRT